MAKEQHGIKRWTADGNAVIVDCGCVPSVAVLKVNVAASQTPDEYSWTKLDEDATSAVYGIKMTGSTGANSVVTTAATGLSSFDTKYSGVLIPNPAGGADQFRIPEQYSTSQDYSSTYTQSQSGNTETCAARTASAAGTIVYPTTHNGFVYELTTSTGVGTTEPTWPTIPGETATDGGSNVWTCRTEKTAIKGVQGLTVGATTQTDGQFCTLEWHAYDVEEEVGDVANLGSTDFA